MTVEAENARAGLAEPSALAARQPVEGLVRRYPARTPKGFLRPCESPDDESRRFEYYDPAHRLPEAGHRLREQQTA